MNAHLDTVATYLSEAAASSTAGAAASSTDDPGGADRPVDAAVI